jgi:endo-1,4-beta-D-glucanase Y
MRCGGRGALPWRSLGLLLCGLLLAACQERPQQEMLADRYPTWQAGSQWLGYKDCFIAPEGRVLDSGNGDISHSEGQGYAMILAAARGDRSTFDRLWQWTRQHLQVRGDALLAWQWRAESPHVPDSNNASDGDLLVAWGLLRGAQRWQAPSYRAAAEAILRDLADRAVRMTAGGPVLLPGERGFELNDDYELNLSYWVYPALLEAARAQPKGPWRELYTSGQALTARALQGEYRLPPDWLFLDPRQQRLGPSPRREARFGFEAIRIPLYLCWTGACSDEALTGIKRWWGQSTRPAAWVDPDETSRQAEFPLSPGAMAVRDLLLSAVTPRRQQALQCGGPEGEDYYSASLRLLAQLAIQEKGVFSP